LNEKTIDADNKHHLEVNINKDPTETKDADYSNFKKNFDFEKFKTENENNNNTLVRNTKILEETQGYYINKQNLNDTNNKIFAKFK